MDVDDERVFGASSSADLYAHANSTLQVPPDVAFSATPAVPSLPPMPSRSSSSGPAPGPGRSASIAVYSSSASTGSALSPAPQPPANRKRASHNAAPTSQNGGSRNGSQGGHPDVYSLPAAVAYAAAHPRRTIPKFGPYLLLQTLGEGEFGKVKLGLHTDYGEEVAVKLIRRGSVDNAVRFSKIEREIEVLRHLRHPNIVRLYDVIETDKYIGIIIEYASGGELFDHILAHRYLRERDAAKLFGQLISGVSYLHAKKIVHRDLKLENLLLDRNRNVIITDFGFANKFEHKADDLMQTSCGSPCYAAPELVISEGLYVGSAVDIWSCGVILYAMLAGYLPFDDDPANPDGDNINLLYKYIINTQLTFPEYVSTEARDLLGMMLVPDPSRRCDLDSIKRHPWLAAYSGLFEKTVDELEAQAMELQDAKRLQYQKMMKSREKEATVPPHVKMNRTQSARMDTGSGGGAPMSGSAMSSSASTRTGRGHQQHEFLYETGGSDLAPPTTRRRVAASAIIATSHASAYDDDPFGASQPSANGREQSQEGGARSRKSSTVSKTNKSPSKASSPPVQSPQGQKKKGGYRHTLQVEYDDGDQSSSLPQTNGALSVSHGDVFSSSPTAAMPPFPDILARGESSTTNTSIISTSINGGAETVTSVSSNGVAETDGAVSVVDMSYATMHRPPEVVAEHRMKEEDAELNGDGQDTPRKPSRDISNTTPRGKTTPPSINTTAASPAAMASSPTTPRGSSKVSGTSPTTPPPAFRRPTAPESGLPARDLTENNSHSGPLASPITLPSPSASTLEDKPQDLVGPTSSTSSAISVPHSTSSVSNKSRTRHRKGLSLDKFNLANLLGKSDPVEKYGGGSRPPTIGSKKQSEGPPTSFDPRSVPVPAPSIAGSETASTKSKASKRKTFTLMMAEPFGTAKAAARDRSQAHRSVTGPLNTPPASASAPVSKRLSPTEKVPVTADVNGTFAEKSAAKAAFLPPSLAADAGNDMGPGGSTGKAKKVMDWFRKRSLAKNAGDSPFSPTQPPADPHRPAAVTTFGLAATELEPSTPTVDTYRTKQNGDSSTSLSAPQVVITAAEGQSANWGISPRSASGQSHGSTDTSASAQSGQKGPPSSGITVIPSTSHIPPVAKRAAEALANVAFRHPTPSAPVPNRPFTTSMLRVHHGAVDQATITTGWPPEVFEHVTKVLITMGIEIQRESEFKYRCIRHKRKKTAMAGLGIKDSGSTGLSAFTLSGSAASNGVDKRGLPIPSSNSFGATGGMLRGLLMRRGSQSPAPQFTSPVPSPQIDADDDRGLSPVSSPDPSTVSKQPIYGDRTEDLQDEVRFSVELTRIDRLDETFSLDIRRLKGNLRSYKYLYDILRDRAMPAQ